MAASLRWGNEWDIAAAALIVTEAGGKVTDALGNALSFNADPPRAFGVLAAAPGIYSAAVRHLQAQAAELAARSRSSGSGSSRPCVPRLRPLPPPHARSRPIASIRPLRRPRRRRPRPRPTPPTRGRRPPFRPPRPAAAARARQLRRAHALRGF